jgi:putative copper resistance protein D
VREWLALTTSTRWLRLLTGPLAAAVVAGLLPWLLVFTPAFRWIVTDAAGQQFGEALLLTGGIIVVGAALTGTGAGPVRALPAAVGALAWGAAGLVLLVSDALLLADWYGAMGWGADAVADQRAGGVVLLVAAAVPLAVLAGVAWRRGGALVGAERPPSSTDTRYRAMLDRAGRRG